MFNNDVRKESRAVLLQRLRCYQKRALCNFCNTCPSFLCFQFMYTPDKNAVVDVESLVTMSNYPLRRTKEPCNGKNGGRTLSVESLNRSGPVLFQALGLSCCVKKNSATGKTVGQTRSVESL